MTWDRLARVALTLYVILLLLSTRLLSAAGGRVAVYGFLAGVATIAVVAESRRLRLWSMAAILLAVVLMIRDSRDGMARAERLGAVRAGAVHRPATEPSADRGVLESSP